MTHAFRKMGDLVTVPELLDVPSVKKVIAENTMGGNRPGSPIYYYQGIFDELTFPEPVDKLVKTYCGEGVSVQYQREIGEHGSAALTGAPGALLYLNDRPAGKPAPSNCTP